MEKMLDIAVNGHTVHCRVLGSGPPLLVVHGGMGYGHGSFRPWLDPLAAHHTLVFVDLPGNGESQTPADIDEWDTLDPLVECLHQLRSSLGYEQWNVMGHSFGGLVVQGYALAHPDDISSLVISCSTPAMDHPEESRQAARLACTSDQQYDTLSTRLLGPKSSDEEYDEIWAAVYSAYFADPDLVDSGRLKPATGGSSAAFNATLRIWPNSNMVPHLPTIGTIPTLVLGAAKDWTFPPTVGPRRLHRLIPGSQYVEFAASGHYPFIEEQNKFLDTLTTWLTSRTTS